MMIHRHQNHKRNGQTRCALTGSRLRVSLPGLHKKCSLEERQPSTRTPL